MDSTKIQLFDNPDFGHLRVTTNDAGETWFVATDICGILGLDNTALRKLADDEKGKDLIPTPGGEQKLNVVNEPGLYKLVMRSRKPEAIKFQRWVTHEVLPSIRATGSYSATEDESLTMARGLIAAQTIVNRLQAANDDLATENALMAPKAAYYDSVMDADGLLSVRDSAKLLKSHDKSITDHGLRASLRHDHIIEQRTLHATAYGIERGYVTERPFTIPHSDGTKTLKYYGCLTPKGLDWCVRRYCGKGVA